MKGMIDTALVFGIGRTDDCEGPCIVRNGYETFAVTPTDTPGAYRVRA